MNDFTRLLTVKRDPSGVASLSANKVPVVTLVFWMIKVLSTTVGETGADYLAVHVGVGAQLTAAFMCSFLLASLVVQLRSPTYVPWKYWLTVVLLSVVGTELTDGLTDGLGVSLYRSTAVFAFLLTLLFVMWHRSEGTLSIQKIDTRRRELFYWSAVLLTFALGTAAGDLATEELGLGFRLGVVIFSLLIGVAAISWKLGLNAVLAFWIAYILTRPLGASLGDLLAQAQEYGGVGLGTVTTSLVFLGLIIGLVFYISRIAYSRPAK